MNLETKITIYKFTPQLFTLTLDELGRAHVLYRAGEGIGGKSRRRDA